MERVISRDDIRFRNNVWCIHGFACRLVSRRHGDRSRGLFRQNNSHRIVPGVQIESRSCLGEFHGCVVETRDVVRVTMYIMDSAAFSGILMGNRVYESARERKRRGRLRANVIGKDGRIN